MLIKPQANSACKSELDLESDEQVDHSKQVTTLDGLNQRFWKAMVLMAKRAGRYASGRCDLVRVAYKGLHHL